MIEYERFGFASAPRTATAWMTNALQLFGLHPLQIDGRVVEEDSREPTRRVEPYDAWNPGRINKPVITIVRHPVDWLYSYAWTRTDLFQSYPPVFDGFDELNCFDVLWCKSHGIENFIRRSVVDNPGGVGRMFDAYKASTVLRLEDFPLAPMEELQTLGIDSALTGMMADMPPTNCRRVSLTCSDSLRRLIWESEKDFCERYEYGPYRRGI